MQATNWAWVALHTVPVESHITSTMKGIQVVVWCQLVMHRTWKDRKRLEIHHTFLLNADWLSCFITQLGTVIIYIYWAQTQNSDSCGTFLSHTIIKRTVQPDMRLELCLSQRQSGITGDLHQLENVVNHKTTWAAWAADSSCWSHVWMTLCDDRKPMHESILQQHELWANTHTSHIPCKPMHSICNILISPTEPTVKLLGQRTTRKHHHIKPVWRNPKQSKLTGPCCIGLDTRRGSSTQTQGYDCPAHPPCQHSGHLLVIVCHLLEICHEGGDRSGVGCRTSDCMLVELLIASITALPNGVESWQANPAFIQHTLALSVKATLSVTFYHLHICIA